MRRSRDERGKKRFVGEDVDVIVERKEEEEKVSSNLATSVKPVTLPLISLSLSFGWYVKIWF